MSAALIQKKDDELARALPDFFWSVQAGILSLYSFFNSGPIAASFMMSLC
jgi:hypothetical protein